jgi:Ca-activated chloride channel family protein
MLKHSHTRPVLLALFALSCLAAAEDRCDSAGGPTYRSTVSEVRVTFFATDENNQPLQTLTKLDFAVVDNERVVRNFRSLQHSNETALNVVVLVDLSESVAPRFRVAISDVLQLVAREQSIADDNIAVLSFAGTQDVRGTSRQTSDGIRPAILCSSGCRASDSVAKLQAVKSGGLTPLFDALIFAADFISHHRSAGVRPVLILFSDGNDTISLHSANDALQAAQDAGALIYSVDVGASDRQTSGGVFLQQVSGATGGRYFSPRFSLNDGGASLLNTVLEDLRDSYLRSAQPSGRISCSSPLAHSQS